MYVCINILTKGFEYIAPYFSCDFFQSFSQIYIKTLLTFPIQNE